MSDLYDKIKEDVAFPQDVGGKMWLRLRIALSCTECTENAPKKLKWQKAA